MHEPVEPPAPQPPAGPVSASLLADQLVRNETAGFRALFHAENSAAPMLIWSPDTLCLENSPLGNFAKVCDGLAGSAGGALNRARFSLDPFGSIQDWMMVLRRAPGGEMTYVHYGLGISRIYGQDMTGRRMGGFPDHITTFFRAAYDAVARRRERLLSVHQPPREVFVSTCRRLIVPLLDGADCTGFAVLNQPTNELRDGLEILPAPVLIADRDTIVRYANKEARQVFDAGNFGPWDRSLFDYAGLDLDMDESPDQILRFGVARHRRTRSVRHQRIGRFMASVSAARHHATAFYVILLHPEPNAGAA